MKKIIFCFLVSALTISVSQATTWGNNSILLTGIQADLDHNYEPVLTFNGDVANSSCAYKAYGSVSKSIADYKDLLAIAMMAFTNKNNVTVLHDGCDSRGYVKVVGILVEQLG